MKKLTISIIMFSALLSQVPIFGMVSKPVGGKRAKEAWYREQYPVTYDVILEEGFKITNPTQIAFLHAVEANDVNSVKQYAQKFNLNEGNLFLVAHQIAISKTNMPMAQLLKKLRTQQNYPIARRIE